MVYTWVYIALVVLFFSAVLLAGARYMRLMRVKADNQNRRLKQQMTSNVSHELRTPVTSIRGYLETLLACPDMDEQKRKMFIERAYNQTLRLSELISDMALISKMEESPDKLPKQGVDIGYVASEVFAEFAEKIESKGIKVENFLEEGFVINGNYSLLYALLRNLVENSLKYAGDGVTLHVECYSRSEHRCYFTYYDTGAGVPEEHINRIFERFYRVSEGRTRDKGGSGLGLSIVRNSVAFHGGDIRVMNRQWGGLQFFFSLSV